MKIYKETKQILKVGGVPGYILLGYYAVQIIFARQKADMAAIDFSAVIFAAYALGGGYYCYTYLQKTPARKQFMTQMLTRTPLLFFVIYTVICGISSLWSPMFALSAYRAVECMGMMIIMVATLETLLRTVTFKGALMWSAVYGTLTVAMLFLSASSVGIGLYVCQMPATIFFYLCFYYAPRWMFRWPLMTIALFCKSTTGYIGMTLGMCSLMIGKAKYRILGAAIGLGILGAVSAMGVDNVLNNTIFASKGGAMVDGQFDDKKTSGRNEIWEAALTTIKEEHHEWYGYGFVAGETMFAYGLKGSYVIGMHNGFLSAYVGTGYVGLFFFALFMFGYAIIPFRKEIPKEYKQVLVALMCAVMIHTYANPGLGFRVYGTWMPGMYMVVLTCGLFVKGRDMLPLKKQKRK